MEFLQQRAKRVDLDLPARRPYVSPVVIDGRHRHPLLAAATPGAATRTASSATSSSAPPPPPTSASERRSKTHQDMRAFVSDMTRERERQGQAQRGPERQQYYFGVPPNSQAGSGFISNGAFYNGVVELSRRPDGGAARRVRRDRRHDHDDVDDLPLPPPPSPPVQEDAQRVHGEEDEAGAMERMFREAMAVADRRQQPAGPPPRTMWEQRREVRAGKRSRTSVLVELIVAPYAGDGRAP
ncbi:Pentatricopeptide repeat-containing protein, chloroplastic [Frankliniella fusca]|uniref:Pentatricopeptide repeat-containing protein, chloroplastic n=1 Tax=Frankliniella fusca TaxID=407009 RepID=A0AAE1H438_9NEOP|nr:Pentatricopeptide repeat-containing protein, chloroplastic [Frankliniella fusca]